MSPTSCMEVLHDLFYNQGIVTQRGPKCKKSKSEFSFSQSTENPPQILLILEYNCQQIVMLHFQGILTSLHHQYPQVHLFTQPDSLTFLELIIVIWVSSFCMDGSVVQIYTFITPLHHQSVQGPLPLPYYPYLFSLYAEPLLFFLILFTSVIQGQESALL